MFFIILQIRGGNELVEILQTHQIFDKNDLVIGLELQRVCLFAHCLPHLVICFDTLTVDLVRHAEVNLRQHLRVIGGTVVIELTESVILGNKIQLMLFQIGIDITAHRYRIEIRIFKRKSRLFCRAADKADVKAGIVRNQQLIPAADERKERFQRFLHLGRTGYHLIGDARELRNILGNRTFGIDERIEAVKHLAVFDADRTDFRDLVL